MSEEQVVDFEGTLKKLESIVKEMDEGDLPLETMVSKFEEGQGLVKAAQERLDLIEAKIEKLMERHPEGAREQFDSDE